MSAHELSVVLWNLDTDESSDITSICLSKSAKVRHNWARAFSCQVPAGDSLVTTAFTDGDPAMRRGNRKLIVTRDSTVIHHGRVFTVERVGDGETNRATITSMSPLMELGYEADDRAGRYVRDSTGNFISPSFASGGAICGPALLLEILQNSVQEGTEDDATPGEGALPINVDSGNFDTTGTDVNPKDTMQWPIMIGDFLQMLVQANVMDVYERPVDPSEGLDSYAMVDLSAVALYGTDVSATVHFDYWTGSKNAKTARHVEDFSTINNKLYDYLGPRIDETHWKANITPSGYPDGSGGATWDSTVTDPIAASRTKYGTFMQIRSYDSVLAASAARPLYVADWLAEQGYRIEPRDTLFLTPNPDSKALFEPYDDYDLGDVVAVNTGGDFGLSLADTQRVYGWDIEWDREGVERVTNLIVSADPS